VAAVPTAVEPGDVADAPDVRSTAKAAPVCAAPVATAAAVPPAAVAATASAPTRKGGRWGDADRGGDRQGK
jgi:hypothetical protein